MRDKKQQTRNGTEENKGRKEGEREDRKGKQAEGRVQLNRSTWT